MDDYAVIALPDHAAELVLGLRWHTILGSDLPLRARKKAREQRASHYAHASERAEAVGALRMPRGDRPARGTTRYSAALAFAQGHARGLHACCVALPDGRAWLVASHQGKVLTQTDRVYASIDDAHLALQPLMDRHGKAMTLHGQMPESAANAFDLTAPSAPTNTSDPTMPVGAAKPSELTRGDGALDVSRLGMAANAAEGFDLTMLGAQLSPSIALRPVGWRIPRPVGVALAACVLTVGGRAAWDFVSSMRAPHAPAADVTRQSPEVAWQDALARLAARTRVHTDEGVSAVLSAVVGLPLDVGGWQLRGVQCQPQTQANWHCAATYQRVRRNATNASFLAARPSGWSERWHPLDGVTASFVLSDASVPLDLVSLKPLATHDAETISVLQTVLPAFASISVGEPTPLRLDPPVDGFGVPLPAIANLPSVQERSLALDGPLRSLALVPASLSGQVAWRMLDARLNDSSEPALNRSHWMASLQGTLYALR